MKRRKESCREPTDTDRLPGAEPRLTDELRCGPREGDAGMGAAADMGYGTARARRGLVDAPLESGTSIGAEGAAGHTGVGGGASSYAVEGAATIARTTSSRARLAVMFWTEAFLSKGRRARSHHSVTIVVAPSKGITTNRTSTRAGSFSFCRVSSSAWSMFWIASFMRNEICDLIWAVGDGPAAAGWLPSSA